MNAKSKSPESASAESSKTDKVAEPTPGNATPEASQETTGQIQLVKKIVAKEMVTRKQMTYRMDDDGKVIDPAPRQLYTVFGVVRDSKTGESQYGTWLAFLGSFEAVRLSDHERFQSDTLHLQNPAEGLLLTQFGGMRKEDATATLGFAFEIGVKPSSKWMETGQGNSYEYTVKTVFQSQQHDPLEALRRTVLKALPAPRPVEAAVK